MANERRSYSHEFKLDAVRRVKVGERPLTQVAREIGVHRSLLQHWCSKYNRAATAETAKQPHSLEDEVRNLRRENAVLREEREILKKAAAFFAKEPR